MNPFTPPLTLTRRRLMQGAAAIGALSPALWSLRSALAAPTRTPVLSGTEFQLEIEPVPMNVTGRPRSATGINGQVPGPILRWREGDTVTLAVTNRLAVPSSIHWHGIRLPSPKCARSMYATSPRYAAATGRVSSRACCAAAEVVGSPSPATCTVGKANLIPFSSKAFLIIA